MPDGDRRFDFKYDAHESSEWDGVPFVKSLVRNSSCSWLQLSRQALRSIRYGSLWKEIGVTAFAKKVCFAKK